MMHVRDDVFADSSKSTIDLEKLRPVSRLGGITYGRTTQTYELPRPQWTAEKDTAAMEKALASDQGQAASRVSMP